MKRSYALVAVVALFGATLVCSEAQATGFTFPDNGAKALARGGGYMLGATGPEVIYYNPALLTRLDGLQLTVNLNVVSLDASFARSGNDPNTDMPYPVVEDEFEGLPCCGVFPAPMLFASYDFGLEDFAFGAAVYGPSAMGGRAFSGDGNTEGDGLGPGRYLLLRAQLLQINYTLSGAYHWNGLRVGMSGQLVQLTHDFRLAAHGGFSPNSENPGQDIVTGLTGSGFSASGNFGIAYDVNNSLSFGATFQLHNSFTTDAKADLEFGETLNNIFPEARLTDDGASLTVKDADILRVGARYAHMDGSRELFDVELVGTYERWSNNKAFEVEFKGMLQLNPSGDPMPLEKIVQEKNWQDAWSVRLGGDVPIIDWLTLRTGGFYEKSAVPVEYTHFDFFNFDRFGAAAGATFHVWDLDIDVAYMHLFEAERTVTDGAVHIAAPLVAENDHIVNNGTFKASIDVIGVGVTYRMGAGENKASKPAITDLNNEAATPPETVASKPGSL